MTSMHQNLVIRLGALGDMVQALPMFHVLREQFGDTLTLLTTAPFADFAKRSGYFKKIICDDRTSLKTNIKTLALLRKTYFDHSIDLQNVDRTRLYRLLLVGRCGQWVMPSRNVKHPHQQYTNMCSTHQWPTLPSIDIRSMADPIALPNAPYVLIVAGASNAHNGRKKWPQKKYAEICDRLAAKGITAVLIGSKNDDLRELSDLCSHKIVNLIGQTNLYQLITLGINAMGAVGNDTGPQLIIAASGCPTVTLFSAVNPPEMGGAWPWNARHRCVYADDLTTLSVDDVWSEILKTENLLTI